MSGLGLLRQPANIVLGRGVADRIVDYLPAGVDSVLVVTDERLLVQPKVARMIKSLEESVQTVGVLSSVQAELPVQDVVEAAAAISVPPQVIVSIGGGSCIDFAKVLAVLLMYGGSPKDYYGEFAVPGPVMPIIAVPTTAGTGSEATPVAVVTDTERLTKVGLSSPYLIPAVALCDSEMTDSVPPMLAAASGADALSHCIEAFTARQRVMDPALPFQRVFIGKNPLVDGIALTGIAAVGRSFRTVVRTQSDDVSAHVARDEMMLAALCGGIALGTGGTAAAHALQYPVGALTGTPHGVGIAVLLPHVMEFNLPARVAEFAQIARALGADEAPEGELARRAVDLVAQLLSDVGLPTSLADIGVTADQVDWIAERAMESSRLVDNNPVELTVDDLKVIAKAAFEGYQSDSRERRNGGEAQHEPISTPTSTRGGQP